MTDGNIHRATDMALGAVDVARTCDHLGLDVRSIRMWPLEGIAVQLADEDQVDALADLYEMPPDTGATINYDRHNSAREISAYCGRTRPRTARCGCGEPCTHKAIS